MQFPYTIRASATLTQAKKCPAPTGLRTNLNVVADRKTRSLSLYHEKNSVVQQAAKRINLPHTKVCTFCTFFPLLTKNTLTGSLFVIRIFVIRNTT